MTSMEKRILVDGYELTPNSYRPEEQPICGDIPVPSYEDLSLENIANLLSLTKRQVFDIVAHYEAVIDTQNSEIDRLHKELINATSQISILTDKKLGD